MLKIEEKRIDKVHKKLFDLGMEVIDILESVYELLLQKETNSLDTIETINREKLLKKIDTIDNESISILTLYAPNARDMRFIVSIFKINSEIYRIYSNTISFIEKFHIPHKTDLKRKKILKLITPMLESALDALRDSIALLGPEEDTQKIKHGYMNVYTSENQSDEYFRLAEKEIFKLSNNHLEQAIDYLNVLSAFRRLERIADRSLAIASLMYFAHIGGEFHREIPLSEIE